MKKILIFAGTTEGRKLSELLAANKIHHTVSVATEYGEMILKENPYVFVHQGRMNKAEMTEYVRDGEFSVVVDATHPYAIVVTENLIAVCNEEHLAYLRLRRDSALESADGDIRYFDSPESCEKALHQIQGNILLTTGSKDLAKYCISEEIRNRLYVRVLPGAESIGLCLEQGICGKQILALQGPFSTELNEALIHQFKITCLVTKMSGAAGGYSEKVKAAKNAGIPVFVIGNPIEDSGFSFAEVCHELEKICGRKLRKDWRFKITLAGIGMGDERYLTREVSDAIRNADILLGAERMIRPYTPNLEKWPFYRADQIIPYLKKLQMNRSFLDDVSIIVLFSGDTGFYSGCQSLYRSLADAVSDGQFPADIKIMPGISSVAYLASCIGESYHDAEICSIHGRHERNLIRKIAGANKLYLLMTGVNDLRELGKALIEAGMDACEIAAGYQLSYPEQQILYLTPQDCLSVSQEGLYTCLIRNPGAVSRNAAHGISDTEFIREKVPMTKEEIREVSICKLNLRNDSIIYDIGSGTGSIAVETAGLSDDIQVYAIERKEEAVNLIKRNVSKFGLQNVSVVPAEAPGGLCGLPVPTHAFIGGSGKKMKEILDTLYIKNPRMRIVINAVSLETIGELNEILNLYPMMNEEIIQMQVSRGRRAGSYHLFQAENPVWICSFDFIPAEIKGDPE